MYEIVFKHLNGVTALQVRYLPDENKFIYQQFTDTGELINQWNESHKFIPPVVINYSKRASK